ncbi:7 transmembrane receptor [Teladorsagia circumcincta]|uniref:7 transmembrane receptor n=1 Tax=Teladorsagia circumcincta TaxID=45464 RepID=A0A2G9UZ06_TELCI|nr:7 transmembrane receptor [Teladorsagia circumcincta]
MAGTIKLAVLYGPGNEYDIYRGPNAVFSKFVSPSLKCNRVRRKASNEPQRTAPQESDSEHEDACGLHLLPEAPDQEILESKDERLEYIERQLDKSICQNEFCSRVAPSRPMRQPCKCDLVVVWFLVIVVSLETIIGNAMVVIAYKIERSIGRKVSNRYIASLAISDLIIGIEGFPFFTVYVLNVCHTASYMKWQTPAKTQVLIILSWLLPALIFGVMMYGWDTITGVESMTTSECSAPFLSNPYVNMGMYLVYYWTTLIAMLILYKGIHQAAKSLEKKAKAKEQRNMALLLGQRLGTQCANLELVDEVVDVFIEKEIQPQALEELPQEALLNTSCVLRVSRVSVQFESIGSLGSTWGSET